MKGSTTPFAISMPSVQIAWDATSMNWLQTCPRKYQLSMLDSWRSKRYQGALEYGILIHKCLEIYHREQAKDGTDHEHSTQVALRYALTEGGDLGQAEDNTRTRFTLARALVWYLDQYKDDPAKTIILANGQPAVELSFRVPLQMQNPDGGLYIWCGHIDRLVELNDRAHVHDYKTSKYALSDNYFERYKLDNQMTGYMYGTQLTLKDEPAKMAIIDGIELKVNFNRFGRGFAHRTDGQIEEWVLNTQYWIAMAEKFAEDQYWPMNRESCDKYGGCVFREVCSKDPSVRQTWLEGDFKHDAWNPLDSREA